MKHIDIEIPYLLQITYNFYKIMYASLYFYSNYVVNAHVIYYVFSVLQTPKKQAIELTVLLYAS